MTTPHRFRQGAALVVLLLSRVEGDVNLAAIGLNHDFPANPLIKPFFGFFFSGTFSLEVGDPLLYGFDSERKQCNRRHDENNLYQLQNEFQRKCLFAHTNTPFVRLPPRATVCKHYDSNIISHLCKLCNF